MILTEEHAPVQDDQTRNQPVISDDGGVPVRLRRVLQISVEGSL